MDFGKYEPLLTEQAELVTKLTLEIAQMQMTHPDEMEKIAEPLADGSIDPGDFEKMSGHLLEFLTSRSSYKATIEFARNRRAEFAELYRQLAGAGEEEFEQYVALTQKIAVDLTVRTMFDMLVQAGMIEDKR